MRISKALTHGAATRAVSLGSAHCALSLEDGRSMRAQGFPRNHQHRSLTRMREGPQREPPHAVFTRLPVRVPTTHGQGRRARTSLKISSTPKQVPKDSMRRVHANFTLSRLHASLMGIVSAAMMVRGGGGCGEVLCWLSRRMSPQGCDIPHSSPPRRFHRQAVRKR